MTADGHALTLTPHRRDALRALCGKVVTVSGPIDPETLGVTLTHEHLLAEWSDIVDQPREAARHGDSRAPLTISALGRMRYAGQPNFQNIGLQDVATAIAEAQLYKQAGGSTIVDGSSIGFGRDPRGLAAIARATGLNVIMGCSYYVGASHPRDMDVRTEDDLIEDIVTEIVEGVDASGIRAGIVGEVGCSWPLTANERKVLRASGRAQRLTGAPLLIHPGRHEDSPLMIVDVLRDTGADLHRTVMSHTERTIYTRPTLRQLAETGIVIEYDLFGTDYSYYRPAPHLAMPNDSERLAWIRWLINEGFGGQIVISQDIDAKYNLTRFGGFGYAHILDNIVPRMRKKGFTEEAIRTIVMDTPRRVLTFTAAGAAPAASGADVPR